MQPADENGGLDDRRLGAVEAVKGRMHRLMHDLAAEARPLLVLGDGVNTELSMG